MELKKIFADILFWLGDKVCTVSIMLDSPFLYNIYVKLMVWSDKLSPWPEIKEE